MPQAPQQFIKQLLMVSSVPRTIKLAACFRDEEPRAGIQRVYQLDLEMSFAENGERSSH